MNYNGVMCIGGDNMKVKYIFFLYDLGISKFALSQIYKNANEHEITQIVTGDYMEFQFKYNIFSEKDIDLLASPHKIEKAIDNIENILNTFNKENIQIYNYYDQEYPKNLKNIPNPPFFLFAKGNISILNSEKVISIVGTRKISDETSYKLKKYVKELVRNNYVTVSGLAFGTDIIVHRETLNLKGKTVAVLPSPITEIQPSSHQKDAIDIYDNGGVLISEYYKVDNYNKLSYIHRNRIISGVSSDLLISECSENSGTMHTARFAYKQHRRIFCLNNNSSGVEKILKSNYANIYNNIKSLL